MNTQTMQRTFCLSLMVVVIWGVFGNSTMAQDALREHLAGMADEVGNLLKLKGQTSIVIGTFTFRGGPHVTSGPLIQQILKEEFAKLKPPIQTQPDGEIILSGEYRGETGEESSKHLSVVIEAQLNDRLGKPISEFASRVQDLKQVVEDDRTFLQLLQPSVVLPVGGDITNKERVGTAVNAALGHEPPHHIEGMQVFANKASPYGIEIHVNGKPVKPELHEGTVFVPLHRDDEYEVVLVNKSKFLAAAVLNIDGLNSFTFSDLRVEQDGPRRGQPLYNTWILDPVQKEGESPEQTKEERIVKGWFRNLSLADAFQVTRYAKSAAGSLKNENNLGTIQVLFSAAWPKGTKPPAALGEPDLGEDRDTLPDSTGRGRPKEQQTKPIEVEVGVVRASLCIRYSRPTDR